MSKFNPRTLVLLLLILVVGVIRVITKMDAAAIANFSPVGAMAMFGGAYFTKKWKAFVFPLAILFVSDLVLFTLLNAHGHGLLYGGWYWTYGAFAVMTLVGRWMMKQVTTPNVLLAGLTCVFIHWIVTDFGVWLDSTLYAKTISGFISCLIAAIPFEFSFLAGTFIYSVVLFGLFQWMQQRYHILKTA